MASQIERMNKIRADISDALTWIESLKFEKDRDLVLEQLENHLDDIEMIYEFDTEYPKRWEMK